MTQELIVTKIGCYSHSSDFGLGGTWGLPGFHWQKNYICHTFTLERPTEGIRKIKLLCPVCNKELVLRVPSRSTGSKRRVIHGCIGTAILIGIILLLAHDFGTGSIKEISLMIKVWGTILGSLGALSYLSSSYSKWSCYAPKLRRDSTFRFGGHKLFRFG